MLIWFPVPPPELRQPGVCAICQQFRFLECCRLCGTEICQDCMTARKICKTCIGP